MPYLLLGLLALVLGLLALRAFANANPKTLARNLRRLGVGVLGALALLFAVTGRFGLAMPLAFAAMALLGNKGLGGFNIPGGGFGFPGGAKPSPGQRSTIRTAFLEMALDHDSGRADGIVRKGPHAGKRLSALSLTELRDLLAHWARVDPQAMRLLEAYLDREYPDWRQAGASHSTQADPAHMTVAEAYAVLGLSPGASRAEILKAHRRLMKEHHPDHGGSDEMAARLNAAKDILLNR